MEIEKDLEKLVTAYRMQSELRARLKQLDQAIAVAEKSVIDKLRQLPAGSRVPLSANGRTYTFSVAERVLWAPKSWDDVYNYIKQTEDFAVLQRRLNSTVVSELHNEKAIDWAVPFKQPYLSVTSSVKA